MAIIAWKEVYETGIISLDQEHQQLVAQINRLFEALREKRGDEVLNEVLQMLEDYTQDHFAHEERLMAEYGFPGLDEQKMAHQQLREAVQQIKERASAGTEELARELLQLLRNWLLKHIVEVDKQYGAFLESRAGRFID